MTTLNLQVGASADDGYWGTGFSPTYDNTATTFIVGSFFGAHGSIWARFTNVTIPNAATISSASLQVNPGVTSSASCGTSIVGIANDNAAAPANFSDANAPSGGLTTATVSWTFGAWTAGTWDTSPDISTVIQEIINRAGWSSGNALVVEGRYVTVSSYRQGSTYDSSSTVAPKLDITYTAGGGGTTVKTLAATGVGG